MGDIASIVLKRLGLGLVTLLVISVIIFGAVEFLPGDLAQAVLGQGATEENLAAFRKQLGLDRAAPIRYFEWLGNAVTGDFGKFPGIAKACIRSHRRKIRQYIVSGAVCGIHRGADRHFSRSTGRIVQKLGF